MTGCPAWYDLNSLSLAKLSYTNVTTIAVSDPADIIHFGNQSVLLCQELQKRFPNATFHYIFHRGMSAAGTTHNYYANQYKNIVQELTQLGIIIHDISNNADGFTIYDKCDLHIGYRVHAHIYNLSKRKRSILIEEDSRGAGVNEALGLIGVKAYSRKSRQTSNKIIKLYNRFLFDTRINQYALQEVFSYLDYLEKIDYTIFNQAFNTMQLYFDNMLLYLDSLD